jgi:hypothetical protein
VAVDGQANYISITVPPKHDKDSVPSTVTYTGIVKAFNAIKKVDKQAVLYPVYSDDVGDDPTLPISEPSDFPSDLEACQMSYLKVGNPWDLKKIFPGEVDYNTGEARKQKAVYCTILLGTYYDLEYVLTMASMSLGALGIYIRRKDVDALDSRTLYALAAVHPSWDPVSVGSRLQKVLELHEEWMQGNKTFGYDAKEFMGSPFPQIVVIKRSVRLPEGKDILTGDECAAIDFARSLRIMHCVEVSAQDEHRVTMCLIDAAERGKLNQISRDASLMLLVTNKRMPQDKRLQFYRDLKASMNWVYKYHTVEYDNVLNVNNVASPQSDVSTVQVPKRSSIKREILGICRPDGSRVFDGVMECTGERATTISCVYYDSDENEQFIRNCMKSDLAAFLYRYTKHVRHYNEVGALSVLSGFTMTSRFRAADSTFDPKTYEVKTLTESKATSFADVMEKKQLAVLLPEIMTMADRGRNNHDTPGTRAGRTGAKTPDAAKERVAAVFNFCNKPGYNPTPADQASVMTDTSHSTNGAASNRSVTTDNIQCQLPELRLRLNHLRERLRLLSPEDPLFSENVMVDSTFEDISLSSNASLVLNAIYKDTKTCIRMLLVRISELEHGSPPPSSGSAGPSASAEAGRAPAQGG